MRTICRQLLSPYYWSSVASLPFLLTGDTTSLNKEDPLFTQILKGQQRVPIREGIFPLILPTFLCHFIRNFKKERFTENHLVEEVVK